VLTIQCLPVSDYINLVIEKLEKLTPHHFISHSQSAYLKQLKENMDNATALISMDFAENYSFHIVATPPVVLR